MNGIRKIQGWKWWLCACVGLLVGAQASDCMAGVYRITIVRQEQYRWRNDDGGESAATWKAAVNTPVSAAPVGQNLRLRVALVSDFDYYPDNGGRRTVLTGPVVLEYSTASAWDGTWIQVTATNAMAAFRMASTTQYAQGDLTTPQLTGTGQWVAQGKCVEGPNESCDITMAIPDPRQYCNVEFCLAPTAKARAGQTYYLRMRCGYGDSSNYAPGQWQPAVLTVAASSEPPVVISSLAANGQVGVAFAYQTLASGSEPITYAATGLPGGLNINATTGLISGYPTADGTFDVSLTASSAYGANTKTLRLVIGDAIPPTITSALTASGQVGVDFQYTVTASGTAPITYGASGLPGGLTLNTASGAITGRPTQAGAFNVTLSATSPYGQNSKTLALTITAAVTEIIIDNTNTARVAKSGFSNQSSGTNPWGADSMYGTPNSSDENAVDWFRWIPDVPVATEYDVYVWWTYNARRSMAAEYKVRYWGGEATVVVNQRDSTLGGKWNWLGRYAFAAGTGGSVELSARNGMVCADAVRLVRAGVVNVPPTAKASATPSSGSAPLTVQFSSTGSQDIDGSIVSYAWTFGDGGTSTAANPSHVYVGAGTYTVQLTVTDDKGATGAATVLVTVTATANRAPGATFTADRSAGTAPLTVAFDASGSSDPDGDPLTFEWAFGDSGVGTGATVTHIFATEGVYQVRLVVRDNRGGSNDVMGTISVVSGGGTVNRAPVATNVSVTTAEDTAKTVALSASDPDGDALTYAIVTGPVHGSLGAVSGSNVTYTPAANYNGADSFTYRASDGKTNSNVATVTITVTAVNDAPVCSISAPVNGATFTAPATIAIQATASDVDGTIAKVEFFNGATKLGEATTAPYQYTWTGVAAGSYTLTAKATDNSGALTTSAGVNVTVTGGNPDGLVAHWKLDETNGTAAADASGNGNTGSLKNGATWTAGKLAGGLNFNGINQYMDSGTYFPSLKQPFTIALWVNPATNQMQYADILGNHQGTGNGGMVLQQDGATLNSYSFAYSTGSGFQGVGPIQLTGNTWQHVAIVCDGVNNIMYVNGIEKARAAGTGVMAPNPTQNFKLGQGYVSDRYFKGTLDDARIYSRALSAGDVAALAAVATNRAPVAANVAVSTAEDTARTVAMSASDADGDALTYAIVTGPVHGGLGAVSGSNVVYTPAANYNGTDSFTYRAFDGKTNSNVATVSITVTAVNDAPIANAQSVTTAEDTAKAIALTGSDVDGDALTFAIVTGPAHGALSGTAPNVTYTPTANYYGTDSFTFKVNDGKVDSTVATVTLTVTAVNDAPVCSITAPANGATFTAPATIAIQANASDVDGTIAKVEFYQGATKLGEDTTSPYAYTWANVAAGSYTLTAKATDTNGAVTTSAGVNVTVNPAGGGSNVTVIATCDNAYELYVNGVLKGTGNNWQQSQTYSAIPLQPGRNVIAVKGIDQGGVAGFLAETIVNGVRSGSSANWKVSLTGPAGWTNAVFDDSTWVVATDYDAYGIGPWNKGVAGMPTNTPARWIWSSDANNHDTVYFRCVIDLPGGSQNQSPVALAGVDPINGTTLDEFYFWGTDSYDPDGIVNRCQWTVNGGVVSTAAEFLWTFDVVGTYDVVLTVTDNKGASASDLVQVQVTEPAVTVSVEVPDGMAGEPGLAEGNGTIRVRRTGSTSAALTVNVTLSGDASNGVDFAAVANTVVIPAGASYRDVTISPISDGSDESDELVVLTVLPGTGYAVDVDASAGLVLIKDQTYGTPVVSAEATDASAKEPGQTTDKGAIKVSRTGSCNAALTVYCTLGGTASNGVDYTTVSVPVVLAVGQSSKVLTIAPLADGVVESNETVVLTLTTNASYQIAAGKGTATVTIQDATVLTTPVVSVVATDADAQEPAGGVLNYGYIRFARTTRFHETLTVNCTVGGTASNGVDYVKVTVPIVFAVGEGIKDISIRPLADSVAEGVETAIFTLTAGTGYTVDAGKATATVNIRE